MKNDRLISLNAALDAIDANNGILYDNPTLVESLRKLLSELSSAQPEIMRCKDCRYNNDCEIQYSAQSGDEFFCGCAERKDNG